MFLVDTSVWIDFLRGIRNEPVEKFEHILEHGHPFGICGLIYQEILQGADSEEGFARLQEYLGTQRFYGFEDPLQGHGAAARLYIRCRRSGITIRSTLDCAIAQIAIENGLMLLHRDNDFDRMAGVIPELMIY